MTRSKSNQIKSVVKGIYMIVWKMKHLDSTGMLWAVSACCGQYLYAFGTGMPRIIRVCSVQYRYCPEHTGTVQIIPVLPRTYRYCQEHTGFKNKPVLPRAYRYCPEHTGTAQNIPVLSRAYRYCPGVSSSRLYETCVHQFEDDKSSTNPYFVKLQIF